MSNQCLAKTKTGTQCKGKSDDLSEFCARHRDGSTGWQNRIVRYEGSVDPSTLTPHPLNARRHPGKQRDLMRGELGAVGFVAPLMVNVTTGHILDGHGRTEEAIASQSNVPVVYVDLTVEEENRVVASFDPLGYVSTYDQAALDGLLGSIGTIGETMDSLLKSLAAPQINMSDLFTPTFDPDTAAWEPGSFEGAEEASKAAIQGTVREAEQVICPNCFEEFSL